MDGVELCRMYVDGAAAAAFEAVREGVRKGWGLPEVAMQEWSWDAVAWLCVWAGPNPEGALGQTAMASHRIYHHDCCVGACMSDQSQIRLKVCRRHPAMSRQRYHERADDERVQIVRALVKLQPTNQSSWRNALPCTTRTREADWVLTSQNFHSYLLNTDTDTDTETQRDKDRRHRRRQRQSDKAADADAETATATATEKDTEAKTDTDTDRVRHRHRNTQIQTQTQTHQHRHRHRH
eukprot:1139351-Rhodomonas_salina.1